MADGPLYLHLGLKKTGTSYLQSTFRASTAELERQGLTLVPGSRPASHQLTLAVLEREAVRQGDPLARLPRQLAKASGDRCLISEESMGGAQPHQIERLAAVLEGHEVHLVVTVRDIARTLPSAWQQTVKAGRFHRLDDFVAAVVAGPGPAPADMFWRHQGVVDLLARWRSLAPPERTHVVVVPGPGAPPDLLLERYCSVLRVDPARLTREGARVNESLGLAQVEVLRRLNEEVHGRFDWEQYADVFKRYFALGVLAPQGGRRPLLPTRHRAWCHAHAAGVIEALRSGGYHVVGDLADLEPPDCAFSDADQSVGDAEVSAAALLALATVLSDRIGADGQERARSRPRRARGG